MKKLNFLILVLFAAFFCKTACAQVVEIYVPPTLDTALVKGRIIGANLQNISGAIITNRRTDKKDTSNSLGFYKLMGAVSDTLSFNFPGLSTEIRAVKNLKSKVNVILIKRKMDGLSPKSLKSDSSKAKKDDTELYRILEKDAKLEGKWNY